MRQRSLDHSDRTVAIIFTDLAELLGTAIALTMCARGDFARLIAQDLPDDAALGRCPADRRRHLPRPLLLCGVPLGEGEQIDAPIRRRHRPDGHRRPRCVRALSDSAERPVCFGILLHRVEPDWGAAFAGYLPNSGIIESGGLFVSVGIIGATIMPHAIFLGSKLATVDRLPDEAESLLNFAGMKDEEIEAARKRQESSDPNRAALPMARPRSASFGPSLHMPQPRRMPQLPLPASHRRNLPTVADGDEDQALEVLRPKIAPSAKYIRSYLRHATFDIAFSLIAFALVVR